MSRLVTLLCCLASLALGCGQATVPPGVVHDAAVDATTRDAGHDAGLDASTGDAGNDAGLDAELEDAAPGLDADLDADLDGAMDADAAAPSTDAGPVDAAIARTSEPPTHPSAAPIAPFTECTVTISSDTIEGAEHRLPCSPIDYPYEPPSGGPHYSEWAAFGTYTSPVPWGFLVHDLEHGAVILAYHCENDADCDPVRAEFDAIIADMGIDPVCRLEDVATRFIVVPDPTLPVPIAAIAWLHVYEATCLDDASLRAFVAAHYGMATEALCVPGISAPDGGTWCP